MHQFDKQGPSLGSRLLNRWPNLPPIGDQYLRSPTIPDCQTCRPCRVFPEPPLVAFRRQKNISDFLIRARLPPEQPTHQRRQQTGMKKCGKNCLICPFINETKTFAGNNFTWYLTNSFSCKSHKNIIYIIECNKPKCKQRYIGETERTLHDRICEHVGYIRTQKYETATGHHFNLPGHSLANMIASILAKVKVDDLEYRKERENYHIRKFNTFYSGIYLKA